jgi:hypothetical protein
MVATADSRPESGIPSVGGDFIVHGVKQFLVIGDTVAGAGNVTGATSPAD